MPKYDMVWVHGYMQGDAARRWLADKRERALRESMELSKRGALHAKSQKPVSVGRVTCICGIAGFRRALAFFSAQGFQESEMSDGEMRQRFDLFDAPAS